MFVFKRWAISYYAAAQLLFSLVLFYAYVKMLLMNAVVDTTVAAAIDKAKETIVMYSFLMAVFYPINMFVGSLLMTIYERRHLEYFKKVQRIRLRPGFVGGDNVVVIFMSILVFLCIIGLGYFSIDPFVANEVGIRFCVATFIVGMIIVCSNTFVHW